MPHFLRLFLFMAVQKLLKSVKIRHSYSQIQACSMFYGPQRRMCIQKAHNNSKYTHVKCIIFSRFFLFLWQRKTLVDSLLKDLMFTVQREVVHLPNDIEIKTLMSENATECAKNMHTSSRCICDQDH